MYRLKILGAGSIGNHLANAARRLGWHVTLCDIDPSALARAKNDIYPSRYGEWDPAIELYSMADAPQSVYDLIAIGTPPDVHVDLAIDAVAEGPRAVLVEKPVCGPDLRRAEELRKLAADRGVSVFVGYDHVVGKAAVAAAQAARKLQRVETLDVEFREHWAGIFSAHPWLDGPHDSYLGFWRRGGGASGEHSHAINLWQHFALTIGAGRVTEVTATIEYVRDDRVDYDKLCMMNLRTESGLLGRVVQDVVTLPPRKWARIQGRDGYVDLSIGFKPGVDKVEWKRGDSEAQSLVVEKTRPDDFIQELRHIEICLQGNDAPELISLDRGMETMLVVAAVHRSASECRTIRINHDAAWTPAALEIV